MPSGARVIVTNELRWFLNFYVYLPSEDYGKTEGLCGTWNGDQTNDFKKFGTHVNQYAPSIQDSVPREFTDTWR